jgi:hypothetical protein
VVEQQAQNLCEDFSSEIQATWRDIEANQRDLQATNLEFKMQLLAVEARTRRPGGGNAGTSTHRVYPPKFDGFTSCTVFHHQFKVITKSQ